MTEGFNLSGSAQLMRYSGLDKIIGTCDKSLHDIADFTVQGFNSMSRCTVNVERFLKKINSHTSNAFLVV